MHLTWWDGCQHGPKSWTLISMMTIDDDIFDPSNYIGGMDKDDEEARTILRGLWALMK